MPRLATIALLALSVPAFAQARRDGPSPIDRKLDRILEKLERLEERVERVENRRGPDRDRRPDARRRRPHDGPGMRDRRSRRGADMRGRRPHREHDARHGHPLGRLPRILEAAKKGDPRAKQMLARVRNAIDEALGKDKKKWKPKREVRRERVEFKVVEGPKPDFRKAVLRPDNDSDEARVDAARVRVKKMIDEVNRLQAEIKKLRKALAAQER